MLRDGHPKVGYLVRMLNSLLKLGCRLYQGSFEETWSPDATPQKKSSPGLKIAPIDGSVGELWATLQDAEEPREVLDQLRDRRRFPWKTLAFDQQPRPPYSGTFTKKSFVVGPRTPFAQDPIFDYSYDSGDDWQDDDEGEDVDNFGGEKNLEEEDEDEDEEDEGEFDDWLDDSEDVEAAQPDSMDVDDAPEPEKLSRGVKNSRSNQSKGLLNLCPPGRGLFGRIGLERREQKG